MEKQRQNDGACTDKTQNVLPTISGGGMFIFNELDVNRKMEEQTKDAERELYRYIRRNLNNHVLRSENDFWRVIRELKSRINAINVQRIGRGRYLHVDGALPTDITKGWIVIKYLDVRKARACITLVNHMGEINGVREGV